MTFHFERAQVESRLTSNHCLTDALRVGFRPSWRGEQKHCLYCKRNIASAHRRRVRVRSARF
jgi:hypothetical protein